MFDDGFDLFWIVIPNCNLSFEIGLITFGYCFTESWRNGQKGIFFSLKDLILFFDG